MPNRLEIINDEVIIIQKKIEMEKGPGLPGVVNWINSESKLLRGDSWAPRPV